MNDLFQVFRASLQANLNAPIRFHLVAPHNAKTPEVAHHGSATATHDGGQNGQGCPDIVSSHERSLPWPAEVAAWYDAIGASQPELFRNRRTQLAREPPAKAAFSGKAPATMLPRVQCYGIRCRVTVQSRPPT